MNMKNLKNYQFIAAVAILSGVVSCTALKHEVKTIHNITTNITPGTTTTITTNIDGGRKETISTTITTSTENCDSCLCTNFLYGNGDELSTRTMEQGVANYGIWSGSINKQLNDLSGVRESPNFTQVNGLLGWRIPFGDIKILIDNYINSGQSKSTDSVSFTAYMAFFDSLDATDNTHVGAKIGNGIRNAHLVFVLVVNGVEKPEYGYRDLIQPCPNMCDDNTTLSGIYKTAYETGYVGE
jgi:hypothetical protein